jgi:DNA-binding HxlR family transcriptional regulator
MQKTIEEMTIAELTAFIQVKKRLAKQAPKLRKERAEILARIQQIEKQLAAVGPVRGGRKKTAMAKIEKTAPTGKRQKGVKAAILDVIGMEPVGADDVVSALERKKLIVNKKTLMVTLSKLSQQGLISRSGRGLYCRSGKVMAEKTTAAKPEAKKVTRTVKGGKSAKQQVLDFLGKTKDLHKTTEIKKALPGVKSQYLYNLLGKLKADGVVVHENGMWGLKLAK